MTAKREIGIYGFSFGSLALAKHLGDSGYPVAICDLPASGKKTRKPMDLPEYQLNVTRFDDIAGLRASLGDKPRIFAFSRYEGYEESSRVLAGALKSGDVVHECNAFPFASISAIRELYLSSGISWVPVKIALSREEDQIAPSIVASAQDLDQDSRELFMGIAKKRLDGKPCYAELPSPALIAASRAAYRSLLDTLLQGFADAYFIIGALLKMSPSEARMAFADWGKTELCSPVLSAVRDILAAMDESGESALSRILDTVKYDSSDLDSLALSVVFRIPQPLSYAALSARLMATMRDERVGASVSLSGAKNVSPRPREFLGDLRDALILAFSLAYAQSLAYIQEAINKEGKGSAAELASAWAGSSMLQGPLLDESATILSMRGDARGLLLDPAFQAILNRCQAGLRKTVSAIAESGIPSPILSSALTLYDSYRSEHLSSNLVAAGLDFLFGIGFERVDRPRNERYHLDWSGDGSLSRLG
jgi:6-phosphogluconate dehydrogenase